MHLHYSRKGISVDVKPAVAARIYGDKSAFYDCSFTGFQDTLWDVEGRHYFKNCNIKGAVDFIFGNGQSYYEVRTQGFVFLLLYLKFVQLVYY